MRVLLAHDGSANATLAADLVRSIPWPNGSTIQVINVIRPTMVGFAAWEGVGDYSGEIDHLIEEHAEAELAKTARSLESPGRTVHHVLRHGRAATRILEGASALDADLVVVGSRGHGAIATLVLGSVSSEVVDQAPCPVIVARKPAVTRVVLAMDGSPSARLAQDLLCRWPIFDGIPVRVVSVSDVSVPLPPLDGAAMLARIARDQARDIDQARKASEQIAQETVESMRAAGRDATADTRSGDPAAEVIAAASGWNADLIVLGSRGRTGLQRLVLGSVARNVVYGSTASILVVHDRSEGEAAAR